MAALVCPRPTINVVLVRPQIPHNTGCAGRTCLAYGARLHLVGPLGFSLAEKDVKRAGLDYWKHVDLRYYDDWDSLKKSPDISYLTRNMFFMSKFGKKSVLQANLAQFDPQLSPPPQKVKDILDLESRLIPTTLVFGSESRGLYHLLGEGEMVDMGEIIRLPLKDTGHRKFDTPSLNLATTVAIMTFETWRQQKLLFDPFLDKQATEFL